MCLKRFERDRERERQNSFVKSEVYLQRVVVWIAERGRGQAELQGGFQYIDA